MGLEDLNSKLYGRELHLDRNTHHADSFDPAEVTPVSDTVSQFKETGAWQKLPSEIEKTKEEIAREESKKKLRKRIALVLGGIALLLIVGGVVFKVRSLLFSEDKIQTSFSGPYDVASGELTTFSFEYANDNWSQLEEAKIIFTYPEGFHPEQGGNLSVNTSRAEGVIGIIPANSKGTKTISGKFYGSRGDKVKFSATLEFRQKNVSSAHTKESEFVVNIASSSLLLEIEAPMELASGQDIEYQINYKNTGDIVFPNQKVKLTYPDSFHFNNADPSPSDGQNTWSIGDLGPHSEGKIVVRGTLQGNRNESKTIEGAIGIFRGDGAFVSYGSHERKTRIITSPLTIEQTVNGVTEAVANMGDALDYKIVYRNDGNVGVRDAIVTVEIDSLVLDLSKLELPMRGAYDPTRKTLSWKAAEVPGLARIEPGQGGEIDFKIPLFSAVPENAKTARNVSIKTVAKIDSPDIPTLLNSNKIVASNNLYIPVNTNVETSLLGFYKDAAIENTGPIPPIAGKETTYTMHFSLSNTFNEVSNAKILMLLPTGVRFTGKSFPDTEKVVYNERTNELSWNLDTVSPTAARSLIFQIAATPNPNQVDDVMPLIHSFIFSGKDTFTEKDIRLERSGKTSYIPEDTSLNTSSGTVQKGT